MIDVRLNDNFTDYIQLENATTRTATDGDSTPTYRVYEEDTTTPILTGNYTLLDSANTDGLYAVKIAITAGNGFDAYKCYSIRASGIVSSVPGARLMSFRVLPAIEDVNTTQLGGSSTSVTNLKDLADTGYNSTTHKVQGVVLTDTVTTYTGNTPQTGDSYPRIGANGAGLTALASATSVTNLQTDITTLLTRLTATRAGYLDNLSGGPVALASAIAALNNLSQAQVRSAIGLATANLDTQLDALPTNAELATALAAADDATLAAIAALNNLSQAQVRSAIGLATANLDTQLDALPTNAELATALAAADDAVIAAISALNNLSQAQVQTAATNALNAYDAPTKAELDAGLAPLALQATVLTIQNKTDEIPSLISGLSYEDALYVMLSVLAGKMTGGGTNTLVFRDFADTKNAITATVDSNNNRLNIVVQT